MSSDLPETIRIAKAVLEHVGDDAVAGHSYIDDQGRWVLQLGIREAGTRRELDLLEGDTFDFAEATWKISKVYEPTSSTRGLVATITRVSSGSAG